jgi:hypothetical protein
MIADAFSEKNKACIVLSKSKIRKNFRLRYLNPERFNFFGS